MTFPLRLAALSLSIFLALAAPGAAAWEADVHYGLTFWLARSAGFEEREARVIATGNHRVDSGDMQYIEPMFIYACVGSDDVGGKRAGANHYPGASAYPAPAASRTVQASGPVAQDAVNAMLKVSPQQAGFLLQKLGEALHPFQDTWAHAGLPDTPAANELGFACDPTRVWAHPKDRGGWHAHKADLAQAWPNDVVAVAKATYEILTRYPEVAGVKRTAQPWEKLRPMLDGFIKAASKADKAKWFAAQGVTDVSFLEGITLKDGRPAFDDIWPGRRFPPVPTHQSRQHHVNEALLDFFHAFFGEWVSTKDFNALAAKFGAAAHKAELASRLKLWRLRDHGRVAAIAHALPPLSAQQRASIDAIAKEKGALAEFEGPVDAYFPILPRTGTNEVSPLLPFYVKVLPAAANDGAGKDSAKKDGANKDGAKKDGAKKDGAKKGSDNARAVAVVKFRQAPYDLLAVVAEKGASGWRVVAIVSAVDH